MRGVIGRGGRWPILALWLLLAVQGLRQPPTFLFGWDSFGYWLYLPAAFIHDDPLVRDIDWVEGSWAQYEASGTLYQLSIFPDGTRLIRYPAGLAATWLPWFAAGHVAAGLTGHPQDGFSMPYQRAVQVGVMLYFLLGLLLLREVLAKLYDHRTAWITILLVVLGTNLIDQALSGQAMPHLTLFSLFAAILYYTIRWRERGLWRYALLLAALMGLAALIRPTAIVCVLLPLLWPDGSGSPGWRSVLRQWKQWLAIALILLMIGGIQFTYWKMAVGHWIVDSYHNPGEGLDLLRPHTWAFLFSFRKGWFVYTPLMAVATAAMALLWRHRRAIAIPVVTFFVVNLYLVSSWTVWWYADSFSSRAMVDTYAVMALPLGMLVSRWRGWRAAWRFASLAIIVALMLLNLFQYWQYRRGIIHSSRMTATAYRAVWLKTERPANLEDLLLVERSVAGDQRMDLGRYRITKRVGLRLPRVLDDRTSPLGVRDTSAIQVVDADHPFTPAFEVAYQELTGRDHAILEIRWLVRPAGPDAGALIVCAMGHGGDYGYRATAIDVDSEPIPGQWNLCTAWYLTPEVRSTKDKFRTYIWSPDGSEAEVMGPEVIVHERTMIP